jgi:hypothetical protein
MTCVKYAKRYWRPLLLRWAFFAMAMFAIAYFTKQDLKAVRPLILVASGVLNIAWIWVA